MTPATFLGLGGLVLAGLTFWVALWLPTRQAAWRWYGRVVGGFGLVVLVVAGTLLTWSIVVASGDRSERAIDVGAAIAYERLALDEPQRQVLHIATVDFDSPCVGLVTTKPGPKGLVAAETGTEFVERTGVALSINVAFFFPFEEYPHWSSYPSSGDEVTAIGPVVIDGERLGDLDGGWGVGLAATGGRLSAGPVPDDADLAVPGRFQLVLDGEVVEQDSPAYPRTVAGVDVDKNSLVLLVSDGKQPGYAGGSTYRDVAELLVERGVDEAVEFDGGGSATMAALVDGEVELLSRPSHQRLPGRQRPVATNLGISVAPDCS